MNEKREKLNTPLYSRAPVITIENETDRLSFAEIPVIADRIEREIASLSLEETELPVARFEPETKPALKKLSASERAGYVLRGTGWSVATVIAFGVNSVVLFLDAGLINVFFTTTGYLAYKQFKAAITGTAHSCLKFVCTLETVKKKISLAFSDIKKRLTGTPADVDCIGCAA